MNKNLTEVVFIIDESGSMSGLEPDTIGGYNSMLKSQRDEPGEAIISTVFFANNSKVIHDRTPIKDVPDITDKQYRVGGCTALLDAVGDAIHHIATVQRYARDEDRPSRTLFIITTDGMENASRKYSYSTIKKMIETEKNKYGWEFIFMGANIDSEEFGKNIGIDTEYVVDYSCDAEGTRSNYDAMSCAISQVRESGKLFAEEWKGRVKQVKKRR